MNNEKSWQVMLWPIGALVTILLIIVVLQQAYSFKRSVTGDSPQNVISVTGEGKVKSVPDTAIISLGVMTQGKDQKQVADEAITKINKITEFVKTLGVKKEDITTTQAGLNPQIDWQNGKQQIIGYQSQQTVTVKVRGVDTNSEVAGKILAGAVDHGANEVYGSQFVVDDPTTKQQEARLKAIANAKEKAAELASASGLKLGKVVNVSEAGSPGYPVPMYDTAMGKGSAVAMERSVSAPNIEVGSQDIVETMTLTFELK